MPFVRAWIHYVWATKNRNPILTLQIRLLLFQHIKDNAERKGIYLDRINDHVEHIHCLVSLGASQTIEQVAQLMKGESSHWFNNKSGLAVQKLYWQDDYFAVSVSESGVDALRSCIDNQESHHQKKTFAQEYDEFILKYKFPSLP